VDFRDRRSQRRRNVRIRVPVEADVAVTDLHESQAAGPGPRGAAPRAACSIGMPLRMPLVKVQTAPVPTHAMHFKNRRRSHSVWSLLLFTDTLLINPTSPTTVERTRLPTRASHRDGP
jgi:hypothetical protein